MGTYLQVQIKKMKKDPKKLCLMLGLGAVMMLLWGRLLLKQIPRTAVATPSLAVVEVDSSATAKLSYRTPSTLYVNLPTEPARDLFAFDSTDYPKLTGKTDNAEKLALEPADEKIEDKELQELSRNLVLESTVTGPRSCAIINGRIMQPGQTINGMTLRTVQSRQVVLEYRGRWIRLRM